MTVPLPAALVTFEGIDGSGKTTQAELLIQRLRKMRIDVLAVREPGGTHLSEQIRNVLLDPKAHITPRAELLLFAAARAQLVVDVIRPALDAGRTVICDRFFDSSTAYQGGGRRLADPEWMTEFHRFATGGLVPDRTYVIDVAPSTAAERRAGMADRIEAAGAEFFERVRAAYLELAANEPSRVRVLDGTSSPSELHETIWLDVQRLVSGTARPTSGSRETT